jgi:hypothetical protein
MRTVFNLFCLLAVFLTSLALLTGCGDKDDDEDKSIKVSLPFSGKGTEVANPSHYIRGKFGKDAFQFTYSNESLSYTEDRNKLFLSMREEEDIDLSAVFLIMLQRFDLSAISLPWETGREISYPNHYAVMVLANDKVSFECSQLAGRDLHIRLEKIEGDTISGSFHGEFYHSNIPVKVTNGEFRVAFERR